MVVPYIMYVDRCASSRFYLHHAENYDPHLAPHRFGTGQKEAWGSLTCAHLLEMAETVQAKIKKGKEGGGGLQFEKLTHGFWRRYIRDEVLRAGGARGTTRSEYTRL